MINVKASVNSSFAQHPPPPPPPTSQGYCGAFARLVRPGGGAFANFVLCGVTQRVLLGKKVDWLVCQGQCEEKIEGVVKACS